MSESDSKTGEKKKKKKVRTNIKKKLSLEENVKGSIKRLFFK